MANISETSVFTANVYELATTDPVEGGPGGISNSQAQALANRTLWLKDKTATIDAVDAAQNISLIALLRHMPLHRGFIQGLNPGTGPVGQTLSPSGFASALVTDLTGTTGTTFRVTLNSAMPSLNYFVRMSLESIGTIGVDHDCGSPVFKKVSTTVFDISIREFASGTQNLKMHIEVISLD
jgi:hypothetical protein